MMKKIILFISVILCYAPIDEAHCANVFPTTAQKMMWEGKLVFNEINGESFFQSLNLMPRLESLLSKKDVKRITTNVVTSPMTIIDGWLLYEGCTPHACGDSIRIALNTLNDSMLISVSYSQARGKNQINNYEDNIDNPPPPEVTAFMTFSN